MRHALWIDFLQQFTFTIKHEAAVLNCVADALSCRHTLLSQLRIEISGFDSLPESYSLDPFFVKVAQHIIENDMGNYFWSDGVLFHRGQLCIPKGSLRLKIFQDLHNEGHVGRDRTLHLVAIKYFWPAMWPILSTDAALATLRKKKQLRSDFTSHC